MSKTIAILGSGGWGLALACTCDRLGHSVTVWSKFSDEIEAIKRTGELKAKLPGVQIPKTVALTTDISCIKDADIVLVGIPTAFVRSVCEEAKPYLSRRSVIVSTAKGLEGGSLKRMSEIISEVFPDNTIVVMSGPSHAEELGRGIPTAVAVASYNRSAAEMIQQSFSDNTLRLYVNAAIDSIVEALKAGEKVTLIGFGAFETKERAARVGRNPQTKETINIPASRIPVFKAGKALKDTVAE